MLDLYLPRFSKTDARLRCIGAILVPLLSFVNTFNSLLFSFLTLNKYVLVARKEKLQKQLSGVFFKKGFLKNFAKFAGKHLSQSLFCNKVPSLRSANLLKKDSGTGVFMWILKNFQNTFFYRTPPVVASKIKQRCV